MNYKLVSQLRPKSKKKNLLICWTLLVEGVNIENNLAEKTSEWTLLIRGWSYNSVLSQEFGPKIPNRLPCSLTNVTFPVSCSDVKICLSATCTSRCNKDQSHLLSTYFLGFYNYRGEVTNSIHLYLYHWSKLDFQYFDNIPSSTFIWQVILSKYLNHN